MVGRLQRHSWVVSNIKGCIPDPATAMMLGQIGGSVVGGLFGRSAAKKDRAANAAANVCE